MHVDQTEEQQLVMLKEFWKKNSLYIIIGLIIGFGTLIGKHVWHDYKYTRNAKASELYEEMLLAHNSADLKNVETKAKSLIKDYKDTPYAVLSELLLAKVAIKAHDIPLAIRHLRTIVEQHKKSSLLPIVKVKLARLLNLQGEKQAALQLLVDPPQGYAAMFAEIKGDIYASEKDFVNAKEAYRNVVNSKEGVAMPWVAMKLANIPQGDGHE